MRSLRYAGTKRVLPQSATEIKILHRKDAKDAKNCGKNKQQLGEKDLYGHFCVILAIRKHDFVQVPI